MHAGKTFMTLRSLRRLSNTIIGRCVRMPRLYLIWAFGGNVLFSCGLSLSFILEGDVWDIEAVFALGLVLNLFAMFDFSSMIIRASPHHAHPAIAARIPRRLAQSRREGAPDATSVGQPLDAVRAAPSPCKPRRR
jgi:hypothetical protein